MYMDVNTQKICTRCEQHQTVQQSFKVAHSNNLSTQYLKDIPADIATTDSLCPSCRTHFKQLMSTSQCCHFPKTKEDFSEGIHYYIEDNQWIFTELYHYLRGYCCKNACRHCIYGYNKYTFKN